MKSLSDYTLDELELLDRVTQLLARDFSYRDISRELRVNGERTKKKHQRFLRLCEKNELPAWWTPRHQIEVLHRREVAA